MAHESVAQGNDCRLGRQSSDVRRYPVTAIGPEHRAEPLRRSQCRRSARSQRVSIQGVGVVHRSDAVFQSGCQMYRDTGVTNEIRAVVLIRVYRALPLISPAYDRGETEGETEEQVKDRWRRYWRKLWEGVEE